MEDLECRRQQEACSVCESALESTARPPEIPGRVLILPLGYKRRLVGHPRVPLEASWASKKNLGVTGRHLGGARECKRWEQAGTGGFSFATHTVC